MEPLDPQDLRISDADRDQVAEVLRTAAGDGRIDLTELDERLEQTYAAKTYRDLVPITLDLAAGPTPLTAQHLPATRPDDSLVTRSAPGTEPTYDSSFGMWSETRRTGVWDIGPTHTATCFMGSVVLDLRQARFPGDEVVINASAVMGGVEIIVNAETAVKMEGVGIMGSFSEGRARVPAEIGPHSPLVRVRGVGLMGSVEVKRKGPPGAVRRKLLGR